MACLTPLAGYRRLDANPSGKFSISFSPGRDTQRDQVIDIPCGQCEGCRSQHAAEWAARCMHEASLYQKNSFITLSYNPEHLPPGGTLVKDHFQRFMKRLRKKFHPDKIRFFYAGEYGDQHFRPHYHAILFNCDFPDKKFECMRGEHQVFSSEILRELWTCPETKKSYGFSEIGSVTFASANYVARYICKKILGPHAKEFYYEGRQPEYADMSRAPGIGAAWYDKYKRDVFPSDFIIVEGQKMKPPRFYLRRLAKEHGTFADEIQHKRRAERRGEKYKSRHGMQERLKTKREVHLARTQNLRRKFDADS